MGRGMSKQSDRLIEAVDRILADIQPATVRAVCYKLFTEGLLSSMSKNETNKVSRLLTWAREMSVIPWDWIVDETRQPELPGTWTNSTAILKAAVRSFRRDHWQYQNVHVEVWSEKGTVRGTVAPVLQDLGVTFRVFHGYGSATSVHEVAQASNEIDKPFVALYIGDWDPSGLHMSEVDLPERVEAYGGEITVTRIALLEEDLASGLPWFDLNSKRSDPRLNWFLKTSASRHGSRCWELDALDPRDLRRRVEGAVLAYIDTAAWERSALAEQAEQESLNVYYSHYEAPRVSIQ